MYRIFALYESSYSSYCGFWISLYLFQYGFCILIAAQSQLSIKIGPIWTTQRNAVLPAGQYYLFVKDLTLVVIVFIYLFRFDTVVAVVCLL